MDEHLARLRDELPGWKVHRAGPEGGGWFIAHSPTFAHDGVAITGSTPEELIVRVRAMERILALALNRHGVKAVDATVGGVRFPASPPPPRTAREAVRGAGRPQLVPLPGGGTGYTGEACGDCGSMQMVRTGKCMTCIACGSSAGGCS